MKAIKKLFAMLLSVIVVLSLATTAFAAETGTITINAPAGVDDEATNTYKIYKVFDATGDGTSISYTLVEGKTTAPNGFTVDEAGNVTHTDDPLTAAEIAAIAAYVTEADLVDTVTITGPSTGTSKALPNGYYYITTSTGSVVTIDSTNPNATVNDKNKVPEIDKTIEKIDGVDYMDNDGKQALAQVSSVVAYEVTIDVVAGAKGYEFHDKMDAGLSYKGDVKVYVGDQEVVSGDNTYDNTTAEGDTITIKFNNDWIKTQVGKTVTIKYTATITSDALQTAPAKNTAWLEYGDENSHNKVPGQTTEVYNAKFTVTKKDGNGKALAGAGFVIKNAAGKYYKIDNKVVSWVDSIDDATEYTSDAQGAVPAFTGLANGTYTLVEKTVPAGYNKAEDTDFTIEAKNYTAANLQKTAEVINKAGSVLPSTGGIGTTIFYIAGAAMVIGAVVLLVTKRRMNMEE